MMARDHFYNQPTHNMRKASTRTGHGAHAQQGGGRWELQMGTTKTCVLIPSPAEMMCWGHLLQAGGRAGPWRQIQ